MEENKVFEAYFELPDGYQVQLMVLRDYPGGRAKRGLRMNVFRSRLWIGHESESDPLTYRSQEHTDLSLAVDACYSMLLAEARGVVDSPAAVGAIQARADQYFGAASRSGGSIQAI